MQWKGAKKETDKDGSKLGKRAHSAECQEQCLDDILARPKLLTIICCGSCQGKDYPCSLSYLRSCSLVVSVFCAFSPVGWFEWSLVHFPCRIAAKLLLLQGLKACKQILLQCKNSSLKISLCLKPMGADVSVLVSYLLFKDKSQMNSKILLPKQCNHSFYVDANTCYAYCFP